MASYKFEYTKQLKSLDYSSNFEVWGKNITQRRR